MKRKKKAQKNLSLQLSQEELIHLRDVMSIVLPQNTMTVSQSLAEIEGRIKIEGSLWKKIITACKEANVALATDAPDFVVIPNPVPQLGVYRIATEEKQHTEQVFENKNKK